MKPFIQTFFLCLGLFLLSACGERQAEKQQGEALPEGQNTYSDLLPDKAAFQQSVDGKKTDLYYLRNGDIQMALSNHGARIVSLLVPDRDGKLVDVVLGHNSVQGFIDSKEAYLGTTIGRYGNRIAKGKFSLDGQEYTLATNNGPNHLHGGPGGFHNVVWEVKEQNEQSITFHYLSPDGEEGSAKAEKVLRLNRTDEN
ncbi:MAG: galactose-1-epimerase, partial [Bacteroidota bacterium]